MQVPEGHVLCSVVNDEELAYKVFKYEYHPNIAKIVCYKKDKRRTLLVKYYNDFCRTTLRPHIKSVMRQLFTVS